MFSAHSVSVRESGTIVGTSVRVYVLLRRDHIDGLNTFPTCIETQWTEVESFLAPSRISYLKGVE